MKITDALLTPNKFSRPQIPLKNVKKVVLHYVGNPNSTAMANRNYFENQKNGGRYVSSHYIVGLGGEILRCVPENEVAYCSNRANSYSISIECCHPDASGKFTSETENSAAELCAYLLKKYGLTVDDLIRHYDVTGKQCPLWFVPTKYQSKEVADARWAGFKALVSQKTGREFLIRVKDRELNVRRDAGLMNDIVSVLKQGEVYTIIEEKLYGKVPWGKLKSGIGWVSLLPKYVTRI
ncbi:MAG: N-acetylmuramoyl-L-alanine amidase [Oscillospiraceae bacterium]